MQKLLIFSLLILLIFVIVFCLQLITGINAGGAESLPQQTQQGSRPFRV